MFKSSCLTAQDNLQKRQFFGLSRQVETRIPPYFTRPKSEKFDHCSAEIYSLIRLVESLVGGGGDRSLFIFGGGQGGKGGGSNPIDPFTSTPSGLR